MLAGQLRKRITVQVRSTATDSVGSQATTWSDVCTLWASVEPTGGKEILAGEAMRGVSVFTITTRYYPGITPKNRILFEGVPYDILNINDTDQRHRELVMTCQSGLNNG